MSALGMGAAATVVLFVLTWLSPHAVRIIPDKVRIPAYITIIAGFVSVVQMLVKAFVPAIDKSLSIYLPLIVVNCIILGRAEAFASKACSFCLGRSWNGYRHTLCLLVAWAASVFRFRVLSLAHL
ncbi:MAG: Rnf-Nqr domain containing protein [Eubacteriales bacterium]